MKIGTIQKFSLIDYPRKISAVIGTQGCNMRCFWCHNCYLIPHDYSPSFQPIEEDDFFQFLNERVNFLDAVVISGGEPTLHADLLEFCERIKVLGFHVKLDTNGTNPGILQELIDAGLLDYVAMDIKTDAEQYHKLCREKIEMDDILKSVNIILTANLPYEFRTTCVKPFVCKDNIEDVAKMISGAKLYYLQKCTEQKNKNKNDFYQASDDEELTELKFKASPYVELCAIR
jgi:pyruvate formate lyase activating enzyme